MSARKDFENQMKMMQEKAKKSAPQNSTEALISSFEEKTEEATSVKAAVPEPTVRTRTIRQQLGRPKKYEGEQEIITIKVPKEIKDKVRAAASANRMSLVDYLMYIIENDYNKNYDIYSR